MNDLVSTVPVSYTHLDVYKRQAFHQLRPLCGDTPIAVTCLTGTAEMTAQREQRGCCDIAGIRPQSYRFNNIRSRANTAADNQGNIVADAFVTQPLINGRQCQLYGNKMCIRDRF